MPSTAPEIRPSPAMPAAMLTVGGVLLAVGVVTVVIGRLVGPDSRAPHYWGLLLCTLALPPLRGAFVAWRSVQAAALGDEVPEPRDGPSVAGIVFALAPAALTTGFLLTDPAPASESIYLPTAVVLDWLAATMFWGAWKARRGDGRRAPALVRFVWPMVPGLAYLAYALTAPGSRASTCDEGTCFDGPIALSIPALLLLVFGVIAGVAGAKGSSIDKRAGIRVKALDPIARAPGRAAQS